MSGYYMGPITTEADWLDSGDPEAMARFLESQEHAPRRWQLFACACCWRILPMLDERSRQAVAIAELHAEGLASDAEVEDACHRAHSAVLTHWQSGTDACLASAAMAAHYALVRPQRVHAYATLAAGSGQHAERRVEADLLRDVFGNPFRAARLEAFWRTPTVLAIAADIYQHDTFSELPILGDALEDAGCDDPEVLAHARHARPHVRGCWLVDGLLARGDQR